MYSIHTPAPNKPPTNADLLNQINDAASSFGG